MRSGQVASTHPGASGAHVPVPVKVRRQHDIPSNSNDKLHKRMEYRITGALGNDVGFQFQAAIVRGGIFNLRAVDFGPYIEARAMRL